MMTFVPLMPLLLSLAGCGPTASGDRGSGPTSASDCGGEAPPTWYRDGDGDGYGDAATPVSRCEAPDGYVADASDCDDANPDVHPGATEVCDPEDVDEDCDGAADDLDPEGADGQRTWYPDADGDGYGDEADPGTPWCDLPDGMAPNNADCNDSNPDVNPLAGEVCDPDDVDENCNGVADNADDPLFTDTWYVDADGDGFGDQNDPGKAYCEPPDGMVPNNTDCDDSDPSRHAICLVSGIFIFDFDDDGILQGEQQLDRAGYSVSSAGDVDGDGRDDLLVGAPGNDAAGIESGAAYLVVQPIEDQTFPLANADARLHGAAGDEAGTSVSSAGDLDADGLADLIIGAPSNDEAGEDAGAAYVVPGPVYGDLLLGDVGVALLGESSSDLAGAAVSDAGDVNGDGFGDLLVGAPLNDAAGENAGAAYLVLGPISDALQLAYADATLRGEGDQANAGHAVSGAGDVNGDGLDDLLVGAPYQDTESEASGVAYVLLGPVSGVLDLAQADTRLTGEETRDYAGGSLSGAGDLNGDGLDDILVGAPENDDGGSDAGTAYVVLSPVPSTLDLSNADAIVVGEYIYNDAGSSVSGAGDVNGDGIDDILIGAPYNSQRGGDAGAAYIVLGPVLGLFPLDDADAKWYGAWEFDNAGNSMAGVGDLDADGLDDILVGAVGYHSDAGAAYLVLSGSPRD